MKGTADCRHDPGAAEAAQPLAHALLDFAGTGLMALGADGAMVVANAAIRQLLGFPLAGPLDPVEDARALDRAERARLRVLVDGHLLQPLRLVTEQGLALQVTPGTDGNGTRLLAVEPVGLAAAPTLRLDPLTSLADRRLFDERLAALCGAGPPVALLLIDLDRFKLVNDTLGHPAGDALLRLVAERLCNTCRGADVVSRLGGDEFAVAMFAGPEIVALARRIVNMLSRPYLIERQSAVIGASVGVAYAPAHASNPVSLVRAADLALYQAKAEGRGIVRVFDADLDRRARQRGTLAEDLRRAIPLQELRLHFQPQLCLATRELTGFEALVRWPHKQHGLIPPNQFIPLAEEMGLVAPLGEWVLNEACRQAMTWPDHLTVAVNVSPKQLTDRERLPRVVAQVLAATGLPAHRLEIEITETALIREAEAFEILSAIRDLGVRVSMDDFGTGYSSLSQLRRFPFDKLKIDRSFISDLGNSTEAAAVVRAITALGRSLGMSTVAEGVETAEQETICRADGCCSMQGYLVSRPVPADEVAALIDTLHHSPSDRTP